MQSPSSFSFCLLGGLLCAVSILARAESTKEIFTDAGLYSSSMNILVFPNPANPPNALYTGDPNPPEGVQSLLSTVSLNDPYTGWGIFNVTGPQSTTLVPQDYSDYFSGAVRFWIKSNAQVFVEIQCEVGTNGNDPSFTVPSTGGVWTEMVIPLTSFHDHNSNVLSFPTADRLTHTLSPFEFIAFPGSAGPVLIDHIRWTKPLGSLVAFPVSNSAATGNHREYTAEGRSGANGTGELVDVYPSWSVTGAGNSVSPGPNSRYTILTMGSANGTLTLQSAVDGVSGTAAATLGASAPAAFGVVSETVPGLNLDNDSKLLTTTNGGAAITISDDPTTFVEGTKSTRADIQLTNTGSAGWFVQWGTGNPDPDTNTQDMSAYYDGSLRFWFKGPPALQNLLVAGIRSGNVLSSTELSKVPLSAYVTFDNTWHTVTIPISVLAKAAPWADVSRTKLFFQILAVYNGANGGGPGAQSFWVDNVRWDPTAAGALASISISPPSPVSVPLGGQRNFVAQGFDANQLPVDISPDWTMSPSLGTLSTQGAAVTLTAQSSPVSGTLTAAVGAITASVNVNVQNIAYTQAYNVYSDEGAGGAIQTTFGTAPGNGITLQDTVGGSAPGSTHFMHAAWTMVNTPGQTDAFAFWYVGEPNGSRFMQPYSNGYLQFWVRTTTDLQFSLRSANIPGGTERCKFRLSQLGIPLNGTWQLVTKSLADFQTAEPNLDFTQIANYLTIGVLSDQIPTGTNTFDVADAQWLTSSQTAVDPNKVYAGLAAKQNPATGLVLSYDNDATGQAFTYDQSLAAMNYTYQGDAADIALAKKVFDAYQSLYTGAGFNDVYNRDTKSVMLASRSAGPNAWMLLALIHYRNVTGLATYDPMINGVAAWLLALQDTDGAVRFGYDTNGALTVKQKSTEHNLDCYAAFNAYYNMTGNAAYQTAANSIANWLAGTAWNAGFGRFNVGINADGSLNTDKALDTYSWAPLAVSSYTSVLAVAQTDFRNTQTSNLTGFTVDGFDLGGIVGQPATYKDAVWLEGTAQMVSAYWSVKDQANANYFLNQIEKAVVSTSQATEGLTYATNGGTGYGGFAMDSLHPAISSMAWYLFAKNRFNPFRPYAVLSAQIKNVADNNPAASISWSPPTLPTGWVMADQYIELTFQSITSQDSPGGAGSQGLPDSQGNLWETRLLTDNTGPTTGTAAFPQWQDPTPAVSSNTDSNPAGLVDVNGSTWTHRPPLTLAWSVKDSTNKQTTGIVASDPSNGQPASFQWNVALDLKTPWIDLNNNNVNDASDIQSVAANPEQDPVIVQRGNLMHSTQGSAGYFDSLSPVEIYLETNFAAAYTPGQFKTNIVLESFSQ